MSELFLLVVAVIACWVACGFLWGVFGLVRIGFQVRRDLARMERDKLRERGLA